MDSILRFIIISLCATASLSSMAFVNLGNWGATLDGSGKPPTEQIEVAVSLDYFLRNNATNMNYKGVIAPGGNFFPDGVPAPNDTRFDTSWTNVYDLNETKSWYLAAGTNDYGSGFLSGAAFNEIMHADTSWVFPHQWYHTSFTDISDGTMVYLYMMDSEGISQAGCFFDEQQEYLTNMLSVTQDSTAWKIVAMNKCPVSAGTNGPFNQQLLNMMPALSDLGVAYFICSGDYNMQYITHDNWTTHVIVQGAGGMPTEDFSFSNVLWLENQGFTIEALYFPNGYAAMSFGQTDAKVEFIYNLPAESIFTRSRSNPATSNPAATDDDDNDDNIDDAHLP